MALKSRKRGTAEKGVRGHQAGAGAPSAARAAAETATKAAADAAQEIGLVSINKFDLALWRKFVGLAKMKGLSIPEAADEAFRLWIRDNLKSLEV